MWKLFISKDYTPLIRRTQSGISALKFQGSPFPRKRTNHGRKWDFIMHCNLCNLWNHPQQYISQTNSSLLVPFWSNTLEESSRQTRLYPSEFWNIVTEPAINLSQRLPRIQQSCQVRIKREKSNNVSNHTLSRLLLVWVYIDTDSHIRLYSNVLQ